MRAKRESGLGLRASGKNGYLRLLTGDTTAIPDQNERTGKDLQGRTSEKSAQFLKLLIIKPPHLGAHRSTNSQISDKI